VGTQAAAAAGDQWRRAASGGTRRRSVQTGLDGVWRFFILEAEDVADEVWRRGALNWLMVVEVVVEMVAP